jgi:hypothetical protein
VLGILFNRFFGETWVIAIFAVVIIVELFLPYIAHRKIYYRNPGLFEMRTVTFGEEGMRSEKESGNVDAKWSSFKKFKETKNLFLTYQSREVIGIVPKRALRTPRRSHNLETFLLPSYRVIRFEKLRLLGVVAEELLEAGVVAEGRECGVGVDGGEIGIAEVEGFLQAGNSFFFVTIPRIEGAQPVKIAGGFRRPALQHGGKSFGVAVLRGESLCPAEAGHIGISDKLFTAIEGSHGFGKAILHIQGATKVIERVTH